MFKINFYLRNGQGSIKSLLTPKLALTNLIKFNFARKKEASTKMSELFSSKKSIGQGELSKEAEKEQLFGSKKGKQPEEGEEKGDGKVDKDILPDELKVQSKEGAAEKKEIQTPERITTKILCELIGSKHYPVNEEIEMDKGTLVNVYDENDKLISAMQLGEAIDKAKSVGKEVILRNAKTKPPIVKMMKYRIELVKRLLKKLGKNMGVEFNKGETEIIVKYMAFSQKIEKKDFNSKVDKLRHLLAENPYVRAIIPCNLDNVDQTSKAISILKSIADEINELAKVRVGPVKQKRKTSRVQNVDPSIASSTEEIVKHDQILENAKEAASYLEKTDISEKNLESIEYIYTEFESLIADTSGIDYEKLLENTKFEDIIKGITHTNAFGELTSESRESKKPISSDQLQAKLSKSAENINSFKTINAPLKKQIELLEKEVVVQQDFGQKLIIQKKVEDMKSELEFTRLRFTSKIIKNKMMQLTKKSAEKAGMIGREAH